MIYRKRLIGSMVRDIEGNLLVYSSVPHKSKGGLDWKGTLGDRPFCEIAEGSGIFPLFTTDHDPLEVVIYVDVLTTKVQHKKRSEGFLERVRQRFRKLIS